MKKVAFHTLGCKLNFSETSTIARLFEEQGYLKVGFHEPSDVYVINTCSVTANADKECKLIVKSALNISPEAYIVVVGCYAQLKPEEIANIDGVDLVLGASEKFKLLNYLNDLTKKTKAEIYSCEIEEANFFVDSYSFGDRTRVFLKVQDGCDYNCSFCTIPLARGGSRSDTIKNAVKNINTVAKQGIKEIVLTGVNLGDFGNSKKTERSEKTEGRSEKVEVRSEKVEVRSEKVKGRREKVEGRSEKVEGRSEKRETFFDLVKELDKTEGIERFRISSIEPNLLKDEIIDFVAQSKRFVPHFHIPLQSGSNKILKAMRRRYLRELYSERVAKIKSVMPHCCIGVDVIVGFPGETEDHFLETYNFINELDISYLHVFTYSERDNTDAIHLKEIVPMNIRKKRNKMLRILSAKKLRHFYEQHLGQTRSVLFEADKTQTFMHGFTDNYIKVKIPFNASLTNQLRDVTLATILPDGTVAAELMVTELVD